MELVRFDDASRVPEPAKGFDSYVFFGHRNSDGPGPQIYINEVYPSVELAAHFHKVDQYQVFFGGNGATFRRADISDVFVHYTDAYSTYGPLRAGPEQRLAYATIRAISTNFGGVMPGARSELSHRGRRHYSTPVEDWRAPRDDESAAAERAIISAEADGLEAHLVRLVPGRSVTEALPRACGGACLVVLDGVLEFEGATYGSRSIGWADPGSRPATLSTPTGVSYLRLAFATPDTSVQRSAEAARSGVS